MKPGTTALPTSDGPLAKDIGATELLVADVAEQGTKVEQAQIDTVICSRHLLKGGGLDKSQEVAFSNAHRGLCEAAAPVSRSSLEATTLQSPSGWAGCQSNRSRAVRSVVRCQFATLAALALLLAASSGQAQAAAGWRLTWTWSAHGSGFAIDDFGVTWTGYTTQSISGSHRLHDSVILSGSSSGSGEHYYHASESVVLNCGGTPVEFYVFEEELVSTTYRGPSAGDEIVITELPDLYIDGLNTVSFHLPSQFYFWETTVTTGESINDCTVYGGTTTHETEGDLLLHYAVQTPALIRSHELNAVDDRNLVFSGSFTESRYDSLIHGMVTYTFSARAEKIPLPEIHGVELSQAIQIYRKLDDFKAELVSRGNELWVPLVAYKPLVIRVALDTVATTVRGRIEAYWNGESLGTESFVQSPTCIPPHTDTRSEAPTARDSRRDDCRTVDFYLPAKGGPKDGLNDLRLVLRTTAGETISEHEFTVRATASDTVVLNAVNVCAARRVDGTWDCVDLPAYRLRQRAGLMRATYPTEVQVQPTNHQVRLRIIDRGNPDDDDDHADCFDDAGNIAFDGKYVGGRLIEEEYHPRVPVTQCESEIWWDVVALRINRLYQADETLLDWVSGLEHFYYGLVKPHPLFGPWVGAAFDIHARGAFGVSAPRSDAADTVPHEVGHMMGRRHIPAVEAQADCPPDAIDKVYDPKSDHPLQFPDSRLYSGDIGPTEDHSPSLFSEHRGDSSEPVKFEHGFNVKTREVIRGFEHYDVMSYCFPYWITPWTYTRLRNELTPPPEPPSEEAGTFMLKELVPPPPGEAGTFMLISGFVSDTAIYLEPVVTFDTTGPMESGEGTHSIELKDADGAILFTRHFTPAQAHAEGVPRRQGFPSFAELVPVQPSTAMIVVRDAGGASLGEIASGGLAPEVEIVYPAGGEQIAGAQAVTWTATDADSDANTLTFWVQYTADGGNRWVTLAQDLQAQSLTLDFDELPGAVDTAMIRVLASDGVNTGSDTSGPFSVSRKTPVVDIAYPVDQHTVDVGQIVFFEGYGFDIDDGALPDNAHSWSSSRDGDIGAGREFTSSTLSEGLHTITLTAMDSDGNTASTSVRLRIGEVADEDGGVPDEDGGVPDADNGAPQGCGGCRVGATVGPRGDLVVLLLTLFFVGYVTRRKRSKRPSLQE